MRDGLQERIHHANVVLVVTFPIFAIVAFLLKDASEGVLQGLALFYVVIAFALFFALGERAERRRKRERQ
jgi:undecaprenyl pyrophosphate phosphatase UppP